MKTEHIIFTGLALLGLVILYKSFGGSELKSDVKALNEESASKLA